MYLPAVADNSSPSARKVWIEIYPLKLAITTEDCHLPRGRCGLKYMLVHILNLSANVTFREEGVD